MVLMVVTTGSTTDLDQHQSNQHWILCITACTLIFDNWNLMKDTASLSVLHNILLGGDSYSRFTRTVTPYVLYLEGN
jgi:hypothetical protein